MRERGAPLAAGFHDRYARMSPDERGRALRDLSDTHRTELVRRLHGQSEKLRGEVDTRRAAASRAVRAAEGVVRQRQTASDEAQRAYREAFAEAKEKAQKTLWYRLFGSEADANNEGLKATSVEGAATYRARVALDRAKADLEKARKAAPVPRELEATARRARELGDLASEVMGKDPWLSLSTAERERRLGAGMSAREATDGQKRLRGLAAAAPGTDRAREATAAVDRITHRSEAPDLYRIRARYNELQAKGSKATPREQAEMRDLHAARMGLDRITDADRRGAWDSYNRASRAEEAQAPLRGEWNAHLRANPDAKKKFDRDVAAARDRVLSRLDPKDRKAFERDFELRTRLERAEDGGLKYKVGYEPTEATRQRQTEQALTRGLHARFSAEIPRYWRKDAFQRPETPAESLGWWKAFGGKSPSSLMSSSTGSGVTATGDEALLVPGGTLMRGGGLLKGAREIGRNLAFMGAVHGGADVADRTLGKEHGDAIRTYAPWIAMAGSIASGRIAARSVAPAKGTGTVAKPTTMTPAPGASTTTAPFKPITSAREYETLIDRIRRRVATPAERQAVNEIDRVRGALGRELKSKEMPSVDDALKKLGRSTGSTTPPTPTPATSVPPPPPTPAATAPVSITNAGQYRDLAEKVRRGTATAAERDAVREIDRARAALGRKRGGTDMPTVDDALEHLGRRASPSGGPSGPPSGAPSSPSSPSGSPPGSAPGGGSPPIVTNVRRQRELVRQIRGLAGKGRWDDARRLADRLPPDLRRLVMEREAAKAAQRDLLKDWQKAKDNPELKRLQQAISRLQEELNRLLR